VTAWPDWRRQPHGTPAAARRHYRLGEKPCGPCLAAARAYKRWQVNPAGRTASEAQQERRRRERETSAA